MGTNPIAFAAPVPGSNPIIVDFATSVVAANKLRVARAKGAKIPKGWIVDREGADSDDPNDFYAGGYLLTVGAHKGYGLTIMVEMLAGLLSGTGAAPFDYPGGNGIFMFALSPEFFRQPQEFLADVQHLVSALHGTPPRDGFERVLVPGDPEVIAEAKNLHEGVELDAATWQSLLSAAREVGIEFA